MHHKMELFEPITKRRAFEQVADKIKELVFNGALKSGDRLPSEIELAQKYNVGRQTIREALRFLEISGFVTTQKGGSGGAHIEDSVLQAIANSFVDATKMKKVTIEEVLSVRFEIEKLVLTEAIKNIEASDIERIKEIIHLKENEIKEGVKSGYANIMFHKLLAKASKNQVLVIMVDLIMAVINDFVMKTGFGYQRMEREIHEHKRILNAVVNKNEDEAIKLLRRHVKIIQKLLKNK